MALRGTRRLRALLRLLVAAVLLPRAAGKRVRACVPTGNGGEGKASDRRLGRGEESGGGGGSLQVHVGSFQQHGGGAG